MKYTFPPDYRLEPRLVEIDAALVPLVAAALDKWFVRDVWATEGDYELGYNAIAELKAELMGIGIKRLQMEIRAMRGGDVITADVRDETHDPFTLPLETLAGLTNNLDLARAKLEEIRVLVAEGGNSAEILQELGEIAVLLA